MTAAQAQQERLVERGLIDIFKSYSSKFAQRLNEPRNVLEELEGAIAIELRKRLMLISMFFGSETISDLQKSGAIFYEAKPLEAVALGFDLWPPEIKDAEQIFGGAIAKWIETHIAARAKSISENFEKELRRAAARTAFELIADQIFGPSLEELIQSDIDVIVQYGIDAGLSEVELSRLIGEAIQARGVEISPHRARRIARTEVHTSANAAAHEAALATGLDVVKEWASAEDTRVRESHAIADGQEQEMNDPFHVGDSDLQYPGDPKGEAKEIINCRCIVFYHPRIDGEVIR